MSDHQTNLTEKEGEASASFGINENHHDYHEPDNIIVAICKQVLDQGDSIIYAIVGICFFLGAIFTLGYSFWDFGSSVFQPNLTPPTVAVAIIKLVSDLLLVLIIMEVLGTVIHYLKAHATSLRPFLFIGIVSATRGILSIGAKLSVEGNVNQSVFNNAMIELGVNGAVILALGITLKLLGKFVED